MDPEALEERLLKFEEDIKNYVQERLDIVLSFVERVVGSPTLVPTNVTKQQPDLEPSSEHSVHMVQVEDPLAGVSIPVSEPLQLSHEDHPEQNRRLHRHHGHEATPGELVFDGSDISDKDDPHEKATRLMSPRIKDVLQRIMKTRKLPRCEAYEIAKREASKMEEAHFLLDETVEEMFKSKVHNFVHNHAASRVRRRRSSVKRQSHSQPSQPRSDGMLRLSPSQAIETSELIHLEPRQKRSKTS
eukprot:TRINITY_DN1023_c0_g1_i1.p1 TRINITY_DN1023_c0_g1~~TRINITY_DN1023_c0_g1_i1.p1  ORF type:complete len:244 (-),score=59.78 TRINITY_DN1023_c0_g1_i1:159-890(-)